MDSEPYGAHGPVIYAKIRRLEADLVEGLRRCGVATIVDALGPVAGPQQLMDSSMVRRSSNRLIAGQAVTAVGGLADNLMLHAALRVASTGDVFVVACGRSLGAQWGELVARAALARGMAAAIIDGAVRDVDALETLGFPVWSTLVSPLRARKAVPGWVNRPINCAGVRVEPGDIIVADGDGVVVVPFAAAAASLQRAERLKGEESAIGRAAAGGVLPGELSGLYKELDGLRIPQLDTTWGQSGSTGQEDAE